MFSILQTCVPPYRVPLFDALAAELGEEFGVVAGGRFFDPSIRTEVSGRTWLRPCRNHFLAGNQLLWQSGAAVRSLVSGPFVVEANPRCLRTWWLLASARLRGQRTAVWGHSLGRGAGKEAMGASRRAMFSLADTIVCYGYAERKGLQRVFPRKTVLVAGNSTVRRGECSPLDAAPAGRHNVLFIGRMVEAKKPLLLLEALRKVQHQAPEISAVFIGGGPELPAAQAYCSQHKISGVTFAGAQFDRGEVRGMAASCFAMASPGYVGLSVLDAQSMGLPCIFSEDEPNSPEVEVLQRELNAVVFDGDSPASLAESILRLHRERNDWLGRGSDFCEKVQKNYSIERMTGQFATFFRGFPHQEASPC